MDISIGELARLTGLTVKTIRYYSDIGLAPEAERSPSGYRRYDEAGLARIELVRTLRDLGLDLGTIRRVLERRAGLAEVAAAHADAIDAHIRQLRLRRSLLRAIARRDSQPEEVFRMTAYARTSADESGRIMEEFLASVFPTLPDDPDGAQIDAWVELSGLVGDAGFRARVRQMVDEGARVRSERAISDTDEATRRAGAAVVERAGAALAAGIAPGSPEASPVVDALVGLFADAAHRADDSAYRTELVGWLETFTDERVERYWTLIGIINGWPQRPSPTPVYRWFIEALRARA